jgi:hypothetical protein
MLTLTGHSWLPQVRLPRADRSDLVFHGVALARSGRTSAVPHDRDEFVLYETSVGKYILSVTSEGALARIMVLSFSTLEDVREYLRQEHAGQEALVDDALRGVDCRGAAAQSPPRMSLNPFADGNAGLKSTPRRSCP